MTETIAPFACSQFMTNPQPLNKFAPKILEAVTLQDGNLNAGTGPDEKQRLINAAAIHDRQLYPFEATTF